MSYTTVATNNNNYECFPNSILFRAGEVKRIGLMGLVIDATPYVCQRSLH